MRVGSPPILFIYIFSSSIATCRTERTLLLWKKHSLRLLAITLLFLTKYLYWVTLHWYGVVEWWDEKSFTSIGTLLSEVFFLLRTFFFLLPTQYYRHCGQTEREIANGKSLEPGLFKGVHEPVLCFYFLSTENRSICFQVRTHLLSVDMNTPLIPR